MTGSRIALAVVFFLAALPEAGAFHDLDCGPFRTTVTNEKTGEKRCLAQSPESRRQFLRFRELQREQEQRTRDLRVKQLQRSQKQELIEKRARIKQRQFTRRNSARQQGAGLTTERPKKVQEGLARRNNEAVRRKETRRETDLLRQRSLLEQKIELPRVDLLDAQKALNKRRLKDQLER